MFFYRKTRKGENGIIKGPNIFPGACQGCTNPKTVLVMFVVCVACVCLTSRESRKWDYPSIFQGLSTLVSIQRGVEEGKLTPLHGDRSQDYHQRGGAVQALDQTTEDPVSLLQSVCFLHQECPVAPPDVLAHKALSQGLCLKQDWASCRTTTRR